MAPPRDPTPPDLRARWLFCVLLALVAGTWLSLPFPPFQDFSGHAAALAIRERLATSAFLRRYVAAGPTLGPYGGFLGLGHLLAGVVGPEAAMRVIGALANCLLPSVLALAHRRLFGAGWAGAGLLGLAVTLGHMNAQGLIGFLLGLAVFVLAFARWIELLTGAGGWRAWAVVAALALLTALTHGFAFLQLLLAAGITLLVARGPRAARAAVFLPALIALAAIYLRDRGLYPHEPQDGWLAWRGPLGKVQLLFLTTFFSRLGVDAVVAGVLWLLLGAATLHGVRPASATPAVMRRRLVAATAIGFAALALLAPSRIDFFGSLDLRLACAALLLAILGVDLSALPPRLGRALRLAPPAIGVAMVATLWAAALLFQREARPIDGLLARVPSESRLLFLPMDPSSRFWAAAPFLHLEKRVLFARDVLVGNLWLHQGTALYPTPLGAPLLSVLPRTTADGEVPWSRYDVRTWDHVLIRTGKPAAPAGTPAALDLIASAGGMHLYRNRDRAPAPNPRQVVRIPHSETF